MPLLWKEHWDRTRQRLTDWWHGKGLVLSVTAPASRPHELIEPPDCPASLAEEWLDPAYRARAAEYRLSRTYFGGEAFPYFDAHIGPGNLATFLGSEPRFAPDTVWYDPWLRDPDAAPWLRFDPQNVHFLRQRAIIAEGLRIARGRFLVGMPDLIENIDTLASLRGTETLMVDMLERPAWVKQKVAEINQAYYAAFDHLYAMIRDEWGGSAFSAFRIWGVGRTAKLQCDASACFSPAMLAEFVLPALSEQCRWLDNALYHLDGTQCIRHLDLLLGIRELNAIEWTPQAGQPQGGDPRWYGLYRRILAAGKAVQAVGVEPAQVVPLLEAIGADGVFLTVAAQSEAEARALEADVARFR